MLGQVELQNYGSDAIDEGATVRAWRRWGWRASFRGIDRIDWRRGRGRGCAGHGSRLAGQDLCFYAPKLIRRSGDGDSRALFCVKVSRDYAGLTREGPNVALIVDTDGLLSPKREPILFKN